MKGNSGFEKVWAGCDALLLFAVFVLLGVVWHSSRSEPSGPGLEVGQKRPASLKPPGWSRAPSASRAVDGIRVVNERRRMSTIARAMVDSGWERSRACPALDMREDGKVCEVFFTLPDGIAKDSVRVMAAGGVLTLTMRDDAAGEAFGQRVQIPSGVERADTLQTVISNDVLRVRICPAGG